MALNALPIAVQPRFYGCLLFPGYARPSKVLMSRVRRISIGGIHGGTSRGTGYGFLWAGRFLESGFTQGF